MRLLAEKTTNCSRSDLSHIVREVAMRPLRELRMTPEMLNSGMMAPPTLRAITATDFLTCSHWAGENDTLRAAGSQTAVEMQGGPMITEQCHGAAPSGTPGSPWGILPVPDDRHSHIA